MQFFFSQIFRVPDLSSNLTLKTFQRKWIVNVTVWLVALFFTFSLLGCEKKESIDDKFVKTYVELLIAEQMYGKDSPTVRLKRSAILKEYNYTREEFLKKANVILEDKDAWVPFERAVIARIDTLIESGKKKDSPKHRRGDD